MRGRTWIVCSNCQSLAPEYARACPKCDHPIRKARRGPSESVRRGLVALPSVGAHDGSESSASQPAHGDEHSAVSQPDDEVEHVSAPSPRPTPVPSTAADEAAEINTSQPRCPACERPVPASRWFCPSCSAPLRPTPTMGYDERTSDHGSVEMPSGAAGLPASPLAFDRAMRDSNAGHRVGFDRSLSPGTIVFRCLSVLAVSAILVALLLPAGDPLRSSLYYAAEGLFRSTYVEVPLRTAATLPSSQPTPPGFAPVGLASGELQAPWAAVWSRTSPTSRNYAPCQVAYAPTVSYLFLAFGKPTTVDRFVIQAGLDHADPRWAEVDRPSVVDLLFNNNHCTRLTLADQYGPQQFAMHVAGVRSVRIRVVATFPPYPYNLRVTAISAVAFMSRR